MGLQAETGGRVVQLLREYRDQVLQRWTELTVRASKGRLTQAEARATNVELLGALTGSVEAAAAVNGDRPMAGELRASLAELSRDRARLGYSPSETATTVFALKEAVVDVVDTADAAVLADVLWLHRYIDTMGLYTFEAYTQAREELIVEQNQQLLELSTPVIKLWDGVMAVPLVGTLDSARAQIVMERLLQTLVDTGSAYAIIDITGVPAVDTQVAQHILKTVAAARLMGAECVISGIRPQIAQTVVSLGIQFGDIVTKASLADALLHALRRSGIDVVRRPVRAEG